MLVAGKGKLTMLGEYSHYLWSSRWKVQANVLRDNNIVHISIEFL